MVLNFGIIGCGNVSPTYLYVLDKNKDSKTIAVVDTNINEAKRKAELFNIDKIYSDYREMLSHESLDAVVICTPHHLHREQAIACAERRLPTLCEKPLATTMEDIKEMMEKCRSVTLSTMLQRRFYPSTMAAAEVIKQELLGDITAVSLDFSCYKNFNFYNSWRGKKISGGGVLISQSLHRIDQLVSIFGEARGVEGITKITRPYLEVEDYAQGRIYFKNKVVADIEANNSSGDRETKSIIKIEGTKGRIILSDDKIIEWTVDNFPSPKEVDINIIPVQHRPIYYGPSHEEVIEDFVDAIKNKRKPKVVGADSLPAMEIIFGFYESAAKGKKILLE